MTLEVFGLIGIVIFVLLVLLKARSGEVAPLKEKSAEGGEKNDSPYSKQEVLFSPAERSFLGVLNQAIGNEAQIFGKVRVADVIKPKKGMSRSDWQKAFNKISGKHFDFILCDKDNLSIICAIELDDSTHQRKERIKRDMFLVSACKSASFPLIQVQAKYSYKIGEVKELLSQFVDFETNEISEHEKETIEKEQAIVNEQSRLCPKCSSTLVRKVAKKGKNTGSEFLACSSFPKCRYTEATNA